MAPALIRFSCDEKNVLIVDCAHYDARKPENADAILKILSLGDVTQDLLRHDAEGFGSFFSASTAALQSRLIKTPRILFDFMAYAPSVAFPIIAKLPAEDRYATLAQKDVIYRFCKAGFSKEISRIINKAPLEQKLSMLLAENAALGLAKYGEGQVVIDALANAACRQRKHILDHAETRNALIEHGFGDQVQAMRPRSQNKAERSKTPAP